MQQFSERMRDDLASLNQKTDTLQGTVTCLALPISFLIRLLFITTKVLDRADQLKSETDQLSQDLATGSWMMLQLVMESCGCYV